MDAERLAPTIGLIGSILLAVAVAVPAVAVEASNGQMAAYYASGPVGLSIVGMLALLEVIVFLSGRQNRTDPATAAGLGVVLSLSMLGLAVLWSVSIDPTVLFSFEQQYAWLSYHRWTVIGAAAVALVGGVGYARSIL
ncbi:hypothetical protein E6P09_08160 [Haloferax mediterranei ATCC 33500]|uniref:Uncharacterized protein n=1 Tax=Haloferax mediterranei (strain ATCC 33500 / DSM 1411 / JCM 8866 / NBRC 14739 / NCIMB 2177 / R-4) TaxID=523841 RepID=I3R3D2_HALMT|nr:hypothetical protein [Haloferax mediterranei]AFK18742.1 hypothetical protein HFX_1024 [Haloferax mediterranei ATCC 33500]AHZ21890.1 hypothetical protein BM92_04095 [Haloferax mediterranei ATCC 33500]EMA03398.1 hypothetical protein C439_05350 [Haloferax mediterranei ATCC 33500]MDX5988838.1 hypothetical protein [Haloferax mediterranei ATCC 33500]QCQ75240.1 hypothetical protein E6P09_08160 [Haloferax mediterranei ATCC 33500]